MPVFTPEYLHKVTYEIYRAKGVFTGQELYFFDPSGNRLELRNPDWTEGMPEPTVDEIVQS